MSKNGARLLAAADTAVEAMSAAEVILEAAFMAALAASTVVQGSMGAARDFMEDQDSMAAQVISVQVTLLTLT